MSATAADSAPGLDPNVTDRRKPTITTPHVATPTITPGPAVIVDIDDANDPTKIFSGGAPAEIITPGSSGPSSSRGPKRIGANAPRISMGRGGANFDNLTGRRSTYSMGGIGLNNDRFVTLGGTSPPRASVVAPFSNIWDSNNARNNRINQPTVEHVTTPGPTENDNELPRSKSASDVISQTDEDDDKETDAMNRIYPAVHGMDRLLELNKHRIERMLLRGYQISVEEIAEITSHISELETALSDEGMSPPEADNLLLVVRRQMTVILARSTRIDRIAYDELRLAIDEEQQARARVEASLDEALANRELIDRERGNKPVDDQTVRTNRKAVTPALQRKLDIMTSRVVLQHLRDNNSGSASDVEDQNVRVGDNHVVYYLSERKDYWVPSIFSVDENSPQRLKVNVATVMDCTIIPINDSTPTPPVDTSTISVLPLSPVPGPSSPSSIMGGGGGGGGSGGGSGGGGGGIGGIGDPNFPIPRRASSHLGNSPAADAHRNINEQALVDRLIMIYRERVGKELALPKDAKPMRIDPKITKYNGSLDFHVLEKWVMDVSMYFELSHLVGKSRDAERMNLMLTYLEGSADVWYRNRVLSIYRDRRDWISEDIIIGLFTRFIKTITLHDIAYRFDAFKWRSDHTVDNFYDEMIDLANLMAIRPSETELKKKFIHNLPGAYSDGMIDRGFDLVMNPLGLLLDAARIQEVSSYNKGKMAQQRHKDNPKPVPIPEPRMRSRTVVRPMNGRHHDNNITSAPPVNRGHNQIHNPTNNNQFRNVPPVTQNALPSRPAPKTPGRDNPPARDVSCWDCGKSGAMKGHPGCPTPGTNSARPPRPAHIRAADDTNNVGGAFDPVIEDDDLSARSQFAFDPDVDPYEIIEYEVYDDDPSDHLWDSVSMAAMSDVATNVNFKGRGAGKIKLRVLKEQYTRPELPISEKRCLSTFIDLGDGCSGLALWDSGSTTSSVSPQYASIAKLEVRKLKQPVQFFLGTVGSRSMINYGVLARAKLPTVQGDDYFDVINLDRYDILIGAPFMHKYGVQLDFANKCIHIGDETMTADIVPVNKDALQRYRMRRAGETDGKEADMSDN